MPRYSDSDSDYSRSSKRKKKSSRKHRSRSPSYGDARKSRRRSRSRSSESERGSKRRKRSRSRDRHYSSRSRDSSRRRSRDQSPSPVRRKKHVDAVTGVTTGTLKDIMDILPGFSKMTPAEQSRIRIQRQLNAAVESSVAVETEQHDEEAEEKELNYKEQIDRAKAIQAIDDDDEIDEDAEFFPSHFRSSTKSKKKLSDANETGKKSHLDRESSHEVAIFGHSGMLTFDEALKQKQANDDDAIFKAKRMIDFAERDPKSLMAPDFLISQEDAAARWRSKLVSLRNRFADDIAATS